MQERIDEPISAILTLNTIAISVALNGVRRTATYRAAAPFVETNLALTKT